MPAARDSDDPIREVMPLLIDVQLDLDQEITLESLARRYGYSPFHFHRFFSNAVGESPKQHVDRLRLERAAYKLAVTSETILEIALSVGFKTPETFSRAFKRVVGCTPRDYRRAARTAQTERLERNRDFQGEGCLLSAVRFVSLPAMSLLAIRRHGAHAEFEPAPFLEDDMYWKSLVDWARRSGVLYSPLALVISYDDPTLTPKAMQRIDACIPIAGEVTAGGRVRRLEFAGGRYGVIEHAGPLSTIGQAYRNLADGIRRSHRYVFDEGPPVQVFRKVHIGGDPSANLTEVYFPVRAAGRGSAPVVARIVRTAGQGQRTIKHLAGQGQRLSRDSKEEPTL